MKDDNDLTAEDLLKAIELPDPGANGDQTPHATTYTHYKQTSVSKEEE
jgi:hypothetical protein